MDLPERETFLKEEPDQVYTTTCVSSRPSQHVCTNNCRIFNQFRVKCCMYYVVRPVRAEMIRDQTSERRSTQRQQLSAASTQRRLIWAPRQLGAVTTERRRQLSAVFLSSQSVQLSATYVNSALIQLSAASTHHWYNSVLFKEKRPTTVQVNVFKIKREVIYFESTVNDDGLWSSNKKSC